MLHTHRNLHLLFRPHVQLLTNPSEYRGGYGESVTKDFLKNWHRRRLKILSSSGGDLIAFETIPEVMENIDSDGPLVFMARDTHA